jgi:signal transduction histidine kinase
MLKEDQTHKAGNGKTPPNNDDLRVKIDSLNLLSRQLLDSQVEKALEVSSEAAKMAVSLNYKNGRANAIHTEALGHLKTENCNVALEKAAEALDIYQETGDEEGQKSAYITIGRLYSVLGHHEIALEKFKKSLELAQSNNHNQSQACANLNIGRIYFKQNKLEEALSHAKVAHQYGTEYMDKEILYKAHFLMSQIFEEKLDFQTALHHYKAYHLLHQQVVENKAELKKKELMSEFEVEKANRETEIYRLKNVELAQAYEYLKYLNESLNQANEFKSELLSIAAHDMKNPLQAIMSYSELIIQEAWQNEKISKKSESIFKASQQLYKLINSLLETSAIESGKLQLQFTPVDLNSIFQLVLSNNTLKAEKKGQHIQFNSDSTYNVKGDEGRLQEVFDNLVSNAIKYSPEGATIWIELSKRQQYSVLVSIKDEGPGLTDQDKQHLFKKFQRLSAKPTKGEKSTGLGLWISKQLIELHHGKIWANSNGTGCGSIFYVELPLEQNN